MLYVLRFRNFSQVKIVFMGHDKDLEYYYPPSNGWKILRFAETNNPYAFSSERRALAAARRNPMDTKYICWR